MGPFVRSLVFVGSIGPHKVENDGVLIFEDHVEVSNQYLTILKRQLHC